MDLDAGTVARVLQDVPLGRMVENLGLAIAAAQERLDTVAIDATLRLANTTATLYDADGREVTRSLLELGFTPTFYQFTEATIEVSFIATMRASEALTVGFGLRLGGSIASADQAEDRLAALDQQDKELASDMAQKKQQIARDWKETMAAMKEQRDKLDSLIKQNDKPKPVGSGPLEEEEDEIDFDLEDEDDDAEDDADDFGR